MGDVLSILEWNGTDDRALSALEPATKMIYYITEPAFVESVLSQRNVGQLGNSEDSSELNYAGPIDVNAVGEALHRDLLRLDLHHAFRSMLDHATSSASTSLQRWATATLRHLIAEDRRRAAAGAGYVSFAPQLVSAGDVAILCSLLASEEAVVAAARQTHLGR